MVNVRQICRLKESSTSITDSIGTARGEKELNLDESLKQRTINQRKLLEFYDRGNRESPCR